MLTVKRSATCSTRGGSQGTYITFASAMRIRQPALALKPRGDVTRNPKQGYQWPQNRTCVCVRQKYLKKNNLMVWTVEQRHELEIWCRTNHRWLGEHFKLPQSTATHPPPPTHPPTITFYTRSYHLYGQGPKSSCVEIVAISNSKIEVRYEWCRGVASL